MKNDDLRIGDYTFEELVEIGATDPTKFDAIRDEIIEQQILKMTDNVQKQQRLRAISHKFNLDLSKYKNPQMRYIKSQEIFYNQLNKFNDALHGNLENNSDKAEVVDLFNKK